MSELVINRWERKEANMSREQVIRFQLLVHCYLSDIRHPLTAKQIAKGQTTGNKITETDLECMTYIGMKGSTELRYLCNELVNIGLYTSSQSSRNSLQILQDIGLIRKDGRPKKVSLADNMQIQTRGNILLEIKCLHKEQVLITT